MASDNEGLIPNNYEPLVLAVLFAAVFASISWIAPAMFLAASQPADHVQINSVSVNEMDNRTHNITVDYYSREKYPVETRITLFRDENGSSSAVEYWTLSEVLSPGSGTALLDLDLEEKPIEGLYYYRFRVDIHADYNIEKTYTYETDAFMVTNETMDGSREYEGPTGYPHR